MTSVVLFGSGTHVISSLEVSIYEMNILWEWCNKGKEQITLLIVCRYNCSGQILLMLSVTWLFCPWSQWSCIGVYWITFHLYAFNNFYSFGQNLNTLHARLNLDKICLHSEMKGFSRPGGGSSGNWTRVSGTRVGDTNHQATPGVLIADVKLHCNNVLQYAVADCKYPLRASRCGNIEATSHVCVANSQG